MLTFSYWHWNVDRVDNMIYLINLLDITIIVSLVIIVTLIVIYLIKHHGKNCSCCSGKCDCCKKKKNKVLKNEMNTKYK